MNVLIASRNTKLRTLALELFGAMGAEVRIAEGYHEARGHIGQRLGRPHDFEIIIAEDRLEDQQTGTGLLVEACDMGSRARKILVIDEDKKFSIPGIDGVIMATRFKEELEGFFAQYEPS